jgi:uncharacterized protein YkwD
MAKIKRLPPQRHKHKPKGVNKHSFERVYWPYIPFIVLAMILLVTSTKSGLVSAWIKNPKAVLSYATSISQQDLLNDTNKARLNDDKKTLKIDGQLTKAAQAKANDMALRNYWSHNTPAGNPPWTFVTATGYSYQKLGENLAAGFSDSQTTINGWLASPEHRENMLDADYTEVGFGYANNPNYTSTGNQGPMTIVVAFYGEPQGATLDKNNSSAVALAASDLSNQPPTTTSRAQLATAGLPFAQYSSAVATFSMVAIGLLWIHRHALAFRRAVVSGENFIIRHPLADAALVGMIVLVFLAYSQMAGFALSYYHIG